MVVGVLGALAAMTKVRYSTSAVDSHVFRLHYRWTTTFCFACCALVMAKAYVGNAIQCMSSLKSQLKPLTTYCWISSTFTINSTEPNIAGIGPYDQRYHERTFHAYYQWVSCVLFIQGCLFYLPHLIWKSFEGRRVDNLLQDLNKGIFDENAKKKKKNIISYLKESWGLNVHYVTVYHGCEALNLVSVLLQMFLIDKFLGGVFWQYGTEVLSLSGTEDSERHDPFTTTFPKVTKCTYRRFGSSGGVENVDALCVLPQNIVNEKIFIVMWLWFVILASITAVFLIWRMIVLSSPSIRRKLLEHLMKHRITGKMEPTIRCLHLGDFCILENIGHNLDILSFKDILQGVTDAVEEFDPSAPTDDHGTYTPFFKPDDVDITPRYRLSGDADTGF